MQERGATLVAISVDTAAESRDLSQRLGLKFPLLRDPDMAVISAYGLAMVGQDIAVPATLVVAPDRSVVFRHVGETMADRPTVLDILSRLPKRRGP